MITADHLGYVGAAACLAVALFSVNGLAPYFKVDTDAGRHATIDGVRGLAAFFVFIAHAAGWYYFAKTGKWSNFPVRGFGTAGQVGVAVFFMITAYLFLSKLLTAGEQGKVDWLKVLVSRVLRLYPLYLLAMGLVVVISWLAANHAGLVVGGVSASDLTQWLLLTAWGAPNLNGWPETWMIVAGVTWSLPYEVFFYLLLPALALALRARTPPLPVVALCTVLAVSLFATTLTPLLASPFLGGALALLLSRQARVRAFATSTAASVVVTAALSFTLLYFWGVFKLAPLLLITLSFVLIASGTTVFGLLTWRPVRLLGEISYSIYLLHGMLLFVIAHEVMGVAILAKLPPLAYWAIIAGISPILVAISLFTFARVERPAMRSVSGVTAFVRAMSRRGPTPLA